MSLASWHWVRCLDAPGAIQLSSFALSARKTNSNEALSYADEKELTPNSNDKENIDELYDSALEIIKSERKASTSFLQRKLQIGYNRAARIIDQMEMNGEVSKANHVGKREVLK